MKYAVIFIMFLLFVGCKKDKVYIPEKYIDKANEYYQKCTDNIPDDVLFSRTDRIYECGQKMYFMYGKSAKEIDNV